MKASSTDGRAALRVAEVAEVAETKVNRPRGKMRTDRLVAALVIMIEQAHGNRQDGAATLASSSELRTA